MKKQRSKKSRSPRRKKKRMKANSGHFEGISSLAEQGSGEFEDFYPQSASGELDDVDRAGNRYYGRNVIWIGEEGRMIRADSDYITHISGNIFDADKLSAVVDGVRNSEGRVTFYAPYGTTNKINIRDIAESQEYWEDEGFDEPLTTGNEELDRYLADPKEFLGYYGEEGDEEWTEAKDEYEALKDEAIELDEGDLGSWSVTIRDGNHRAFGALIAGEPFVWVMLADNDYQDLVEGVDLRPSDIELKEMLS